MPTIERERRELVFRVVVMGGASSAFVDALPLKDGELCTAEVQGWHPRFTFEVFPLDPWANNSESGSALERFVPYMDAVVLTDAPQQGGAHYSSTALERLSRALGPRRGQLPSAVFGGPALAQEWQTLSGTPAVAVVEPTQENAMPAVKALAKLLLRSKMKSTPPPPAGD